MQYRAFAMVAATVLALSACGEEKVAERPAPRELSREAIGHYCNMIVVDHHGPKAQLFLTDRSSPIWFSSVRDAVAFTLLPDEPKNVAAVYVNDMGRASWAAPEPGTWIEAEGAYFVIESRMRGGMGAAEAVPFAARDKAEAFIAEHGGRIVRLEEIPEAYILAADDHLHESGHQATSHADKHQPRMEGAHEP